AVLCAVKEQSMSTREYHVALQARGTLALPADLRKRHHLDDPGAQVRVVERDDGVIELHPLAAVPADQRWFWTERWQRMEREADEDIAAGRLRAYEDVDELLAALDR
ncbi:MAG: AbrB/MazE/SpoVT family DNA-binding domain-containing protein, partial [Dehalococcoidia bacterium]